MKTDKDDKEMAATVKKTKRPANTALIASHWVFVESSLASQMIKDLLRPTKKVDITKSCIGTTRKYTVKVMVQ